MHWIVSMGKEACAGLAAAAALLALTGCADVVERQMSSLELPRTPPPPPGPWPRLIDAPFAPGPEAADPGAPDPAEGARIAARLRIDAAVGAARAEASGAPVLTPAERARLGR